MRALLALSIAFAAISACSRARDPRDVWHGHWEGNVDFGDHDMLVILDISLEKDGSLLAEADLPGEGIERHPVEVRARGDSVWIGMESRATPEMQGQLGSQPKRIEGKFRHAEKEFPFQLTWSGPPQISDERRAFEATEGESVTVLSAGAVELRERFNADVGKTRLLLLLSPT